MVSSLLQAMSHQELLSPEGFRYDGRRCNEQRNFSLELNTHPHAADGSAICSMGNTKVLSLLRGPTDSNDSGLSLSVSIIQPPYAKSDRVQVSKNDRRFAELSLMVQRTLLQSIVQKAYPRTNINIKLTILSADGSILAACVNSATAALVDAGIALYDTVTAITVGIHDISPLIDCNAIEEIDLPYLTIGTISNSKINLLLMESKTPLDKLQKMINLGTEGCIQIRNQLDLAIRKSAIKH